MALDGIISDCQALVSTIFSHVQSSLSANGVELELSQIVDQQVLSPFDGLEESRRAKYYKEEFGLIVRLFFNFFVVSIIFSNAILLIRSPPSECWVLVISVMIFPY